MRTAGAARASIAALAGAAVLLIAFVVVEERSREPMLPLRLLGQRRFAGAQVAVFAIASSFFAVFLYLTLYLQTVLGMSPIQTGLVYLPGTFLVFVVSGMTAQFGANATRRPRSPAWAWCSWASGWPGC